MRGFKRPYPSPKPIEQLHIVRPAAEQSLAQMHMGLDEARQQHAPPRLYDLVRYEVFILIANADNPIIRYAHIATKDFSRSIHSHDACITY
jgi:hypothetical protein